MPNIEPSVNLAARDRDHYDLVRARCDKAILLGAIPESVEDGTRRRKARDDRSR